MSKQLINNYYNQLLKIDEGHPLVNILFEYSNRVVLYQENQKVLGVPLENDAQLDELLTGFIEFEPLQIQKKQIIDLLLIC